MCNDSCFHLIGLNITLTKCEAVYIKRHNENNIMYLLSQYEYCDIIAAGHNSYQNV